jgi:alpha-D-ribose 1-methylphosphonate 5-triphosphate synthase subunit PhnI
MYVAVKGGERAIENAHALLADARRGDRSVPAISLEQITEQLALAVDRVMSEGSLYDRALAALAIKQARGDLIEAIFLARAYRTTLPRFGATRPIDTGAMVVRRRVSATFKDVPGGQILGATFDYTHRLLDWSLAGDHGRNGRAAPSNAVTHPSANGGDQAPPASDLALLGGRLPRAIDALDRDGLIEAEEPDSDDRPVADLTRDGLGLPADRDARLQNLARADEGFLLALGYATQRGYGRNHPFAGEIRRGVHHRSVVVEDGGERTESLMPSALPLPESGETHSSAKLPGAAALSFRDLQSALKATYRRVFVVRLGVRLGRMPQTVHNRCDGAEEAKHQC